MIRYTAYSEEARSPTIALGRSSVTRSWTCPATIRCLVRLVGVPWRQAADSTFANCEEKSDNAVQVEYSLDSAPCLLPTPRSQDIGWYLRTIENVLISVLAEYGVKAGIEPGLASPVLCVCVCIYVHLVPRHLPAG